MTDYMTRLRRREAMKTRFHDLTFRTTEQDDVLHVVHPKTKLVVATVYTADMTFDLLDPLYRDGVETVVENTKRAELGWDDGDTEGDA